MLFFGPFEQVGGGVQDLGFGFGVVSFGALGEPIGSGGGAYEFGFVGSFGVGWIDVIALEPALFEKLEIRQ